MTGASASVFVRPSLPFGQSSERAEPGAEARRGAAVARPGGAGATGAALPVHERTELV